MQRVTVVHAYPVPAGRLWALVSDYRKLRYVMAGVAGFDGLPDRPIREGDDLSLRVRLFDRLPPMRYRIEVVELDHAARVLETREQGVGVQRWAHRIAVEETETGARLTDGIEIEAGWRTPFAVLFARWMLRQRHKPRLRLLGLV